MLGHLFKLTDENTMEFDQESAAQHTELKFAQLVADRIAGSPIKEYKATGNRKQAFVYFAAGGSYYSFSYDKKTSTIILSEKVKTKWKFVVGWRALV